MAILQKAISDIREKVRGKNVDTYLKNQKKLIMGKYDLNEALFAILHNRLRVEQAHGTLQGPKVEKSAASKPKTAKKKPGRKPKAK
jgi:hypothetical protein